MQTNNNQDLHQQRKEAADDMLAAHDFEPDTVQETSQWEHDQNDPDEWRTTLYMEDDEFNPFRQTFIVRFQPNSNQVLDAHPGDPR